MVNEVPAILNKPSWSKMTYYINKEKWVEANKRRNGKVCHQMGAHQPKNHNNNT